MVPSVRSGSRSASVTLVLACFVVFLIVLLLGMPAYRRYQARQDESNQIRLNELKTQQTAQLVQVEKQKAEIRIVEAEGIARAQQIITGTLTDRYLQHEAIESQRALANSPNHTTIYIPSGQNGIPLVKTVDDANAK